MPDINAGVVKGNMYAQMVECLDDEGNRANASRYVYGHSNDGGESALEVWTSLKALALELEQDPMTGTSVVTGVKTEHGVIRANKEVVSDHLLTYHARKMAHTCCADPDGKFDSRYCSASCVS